MTVRNMQGLSALGVGIVGWLGLAGPALGQDEDKPVPLLQSDPLPKPFAFSVAEPPIKGDGEVGAFLRTLHERIHKRWAESFVRMVAEQLPKTNPLNDESRRVVMQIVATREGQIVSSTPLTLSGIQDMDAAVQEIVRESAPWPSAPNGALSDDGRLYLNWAFARDHRLCSQIENVQRESPIAQALPRLISQNRAPEAWRRVQAAASMSAEPSLSLFARLWLGRAVTDPRIAAAAAGALLGTGDSSGLDLLRATVSTGSGELAAVAARALIRAKQALCPLIKDGLLKGSGPVLDSAIAMVRLHPEPECFPALMAVAGNQKSPVPVRLAALTLLTEGGETVAQEAIAAAAGDPLPAIRAVGLLGSVKPNAGKGTLFKMIPYLRDPAVEIRAAASAGVVRAVGDAGLEQLYLLFKETDPRPYEWVSAELGKYSSDATAQFLGRIAKKDDARAHRAAVMALAIRKDASARQVYAAYANDPDPALKAVAPDPTSVEGLSRQAMAVAPAAGVRAYRSLLAISAGRPAALTWLLAKFADLEPTLQAEVLGLWLSPPSAGAKVATGGAP